MKIILLNPENTLFVQKEGEKGGKNGYLTALDLSFGESLLLTMIKSGKTYRFFAENARFSAPSPPFYTFLRGETLYLLLKEPPVFPERAGNFWRSEDGYTTDGAVRLPYFPPFVYGKYRTVGDAAVYRFTAHEEEGEIPDADGRRCALMVVSGGRTVFAGTADGYRLNETTFTVERTLFDHRRHLTKTERKLGDGSVFSYSVRATRHVDVTEIPEALVPVVFLEEVFARGDAEDFLCRGLRPSAGKLIGFLGDFCGVLPGARQNEAVLLFPTGRAEPVFFTLREGVIHHVSMGE